MNRIYQGRVTRVQIPAPAKTEETNGRKKEKGPKKTEWIDLPEGEAALWRHHELFQDAVNFDTVALAIMAEGARDSKGELTSMGSFAAQVKERWEDFTHKGKKREGLRRSLSRTLGITPEETTWEECVKRIFGHVLKQFLNRHLSGDVPVDVLHGVMAEMFPAKSRGLNPQKMARGDWPWLCWNHASGETPAKAYYRKNHGISDFLLELFNADQPRLRKLAQRQVNETYLTSVIEDDDSDEEGESIHEIDDEYQPEQNDSATDGVERFIGKDAIVKWKACVATMRKLALDIDFADAFALLGGDLSALESALKEIEDEITTKEAECLEKPEALSFQKWATGGKGKDNPAVEMFVLMHLSEAKKEVATALKARLMPRFLPRLLKDDPSAYIDFVDANRLCGEEGEKDENLKGKEPFAKVKKVRESVAKSAAQAAKEKGKLTEQIEEPLKPSPCSNYIQAIRDKCGIVFPGFTAIKGFLSLRRDEAKEGKCVAWEPGETDWKEFEFAALEEALKAPNQIKKKTDERNKEKATLEATEKAYRGAGRAKSSDDDQGDDDHIPGFKDDSRFAVMEELHRKLAVADGVTEGEVHTYGFSQAALRGYEELREDWNKHVEAGEAFTEAKQQVLRDKVLKDHQKVHRDDVGAVLLFEKLLENNYWCLWQNPTVEQEKERKEKNHSGNMVRDYMRFLEVKERVEELKKPVKYTPADAALSRRLYDLKGGSQGGFKHGGNVDGLWFETQIAINRTQGGKSFYQRQEVRIHYTAPRLLRDGSRALKEQENLTAANWMQPMMKAFGIPEAPLHDLSKHAVSLMPDWKADSRNPEPDRLLLNFVLRVKEDEAIGKLRKMGGREKWHWNMQFNWNGDGHDATLRWPHENWSKVTAKKGFPGKWFEVVGLDRFRVLSIDLGQKQAGAFAIVEFSCCFSPQDKKKARFVGKTDSANGPKHWYVRLVHTGLHRL